MKILFLTIIALVIPLFFTFVFVLSTYNRLAALRARCRQARDRLDRPDTPLAASVTPNDISPAPQPDFEAAEHMYDSARTRFPASLVAAIFGFRAMERRPGRE